MPRDLPAQWCVSVSFVRPPKPGFEKGRVDGYTMDHKNARMFADTLIAAISTVEQYNSKLVMLNI